MQKISFIKLLNNINFSILKKLFFLLSLSYFCFYFFKNFDQISFQIDVARNGKYIEKLNVDIGRCLSPWEDEGYRLVYGQKVKQEDVYSYIYNLEYIKYVTEFSMLHITCDASGFYRLGDTVRYGDSDRNTGDIVPLYPWSLLMPTRHHNILCVMLS